MINKKTFYDLFIENCIYDIKFIDKLLNKCDTSGGFYEIASDIVVQISVAIKRELNREPSAEEIHEIFSKKIEKAKRLLNVIEDITTYKKEI